jgi:alpha-tubulin suppressor-like RCC1 family protein
VVVDDPTLVSTPGSPVVDLAADLDDTCVLHADDTVSCWGDDAYGQLGLGSATGFGQASQVAMGHNFTCARMADQTVRCSGLNDEGQLGNGAMSGEEAHDVPSSVAGLSGITQIAAGYDHACALASSDGTVSCWGSELRLVPWQVTNIEGLADVSQVAAGEAFTCALRTDRSVACWGVNLEGEIGDGTTAFRSAPTQVAGLQSVMQLAVCGFHACALTDSNGVYCWGLNAHGEIGDGTTVDRTEPTRIDL